MEPKRAGDLARETLEALERSGILAQLAELPVPDLDDLDLSRLQELVDSLRQSVARGGSVEEVVRRIARLIEAQLGAARPAWPPRDG